jgi:hypothetical protein
MNLESYGNLKKYINFNFLSCQFVNVKEKIPLTNKSTFINRGDSVKHDSEGLFIGLNSPYPPQHRFFNYFGRHVGKHSR